MVMGTGGYLDQAFILSTTGMLRWLRDNYGLKPDEAAAMLGNFAKYEIAEAADPEIDVIAKLPKSTLVQIPKN
jgi:acetamidase/formamidase